MKSTDEHVGKIEKQLTRWGATLDQMVARADTAGAEAKVGHRERIGELRAKHKIARGKLDQLKAATGDEWETLKDGLESTCNDLEAAFKKLVN